MTILQTAETIILTTMEWLDTGKALGTCFRAEVLTTNPDGSPATAKHYYRLKLSMLRRSMLHRLDAQEEMSILEPPLPY